MAPAPPPAPPLPSPKTLRKGTSIGRQDAVQPGAGAPRKWAPVQTDRRDDDHHMELGHMGIKLPVLVLPGTKEREKKKVFRRFVKTEAEEGSACREDESPLQASTALRQTKKLPNAGASGGLSFLEELKARAKMTQERAQERENREQKTQQTLTSPESRRIAAVPGQETNQYGQVFESAHTTEQPQKRVPKPARVPGPPQLRLGPHKHSTPATQQPPALEEDDYANFPLRTETSEDRGIYENVPPIPPRTYENLPSRGLGPNVKPNSQGVFPPAPPPRDRTKERSPLQADGAEATLPSPPSWLMQDRPDSMAPPSPPPPSPVSAGFSLDLFVGSKNVFGLIEQNFADFIAPKELAMVMFYDPSNSNSLQPKEHFKKAADAMGPSQFAAVDCNVQPRFCVNQGVTTIPTFKIYARGDVLSTIREVSRFDDKEMRQYMETLSEMRQPGGRVCTNMPKPQESKCSLAKRLGFKK